MPAAEARVETLSVVTPEGMSISFAIAPTGLRVRAFAADFGTLLVATVALLVLVVAASCLSFAIGAFEVVVAPLLVLQFVVANFYFALLELHRGGTTPGKRRHGLRVISRDGAPLTPQAILARNLTRSVEIWFPILYLLDPGGLFPRASVWWSVLAAVWVLVLGFVPLFNRQRLRIGDLIAGTVVVRVTHPILLPDPAATRRLQNAPTIAFLAEELALFDGSTLERLDRCLRMLDSRSRHAPPPPLAALRKDLECRMGRMHMEDVGHLTFLRSFYLALRDHLEKKRLEPTS